MKAPIVLTLLALVAAGAEAAPLTGPIAELAPLLGVWEVEGEWAGGQTVWSRAHYAPGINGRMIEGRILVKDGDGAPYVRYHTVFSHDATRDAWIANSFHRDGTASDLEFRYEDGVIHTEWTEGDTTIRDRSELLGDDRMRWTVAVASAGSDEFETILDATWIKRGEDRMPKPIDTNLFAPDENLTSFVSEATIQAPVSAVYRAWTDGEAFAAAYGPDRAELRADIDLVIGGRYEWLWDGKTGSNGCQILSYIPDRMISFSWNAPQDQADSRAQRTWVVVEFEPTDEGGTHCRVTHQGFGEADHWRETHAYFEKAWPYVLDQFRKNLEPRHAAEGTR